MQGELIAQSLSYLDKDRPVEFSGATH